jgi:hypothetical protein
MRAMWREWAWWAVGLMSCGSSGDWRARAEPNLTISSIIVNVDQINIDMINESAIQP